MTNSLNNSSYLTRLLSMRQKTANARHKRASIFSPAPVLAMPDTPPPSQPADISHNANISNSVTSGDDDRLATFHKGDDHRRHLPFALSPTIRQHSPSFRLFATHGLFVRPTRWPLVSLLLLLLTLSINCASFSSNPLQVPQQQRSILANCLFGTKPVLINDVVDNLNFELEPPNHVVSEDTFSIFTLRTRTSLAKYIHVAVVANLSNNVLALHESKLNISIKDFKGDVAFENVKAEPVYQRYCSMSSQVVPLYSWLLSLDTSKVGPGWENSTTTWQISWQGPAIGRNYSIQLHVFTVNRDRSLVNYLKANSLIRGVNIDYDCDDFSVRGKPVLSWEAGKSSIQVSATPLVPSSFDGRKSATLIIEDVSKQAGIQGFLTACAPWNATTQSIQIQNAFGKWFLADDGSTMARRSECAYSSYREFDRRRKFVVKLVYSPPTIDGEPQSEIVNEQIECMALVVLGDGSVYLVFPPSSITQFRTTTTSSSTTAKPAEVADQEAAVVGFVETNSTTADIGEDSTNKTITILVIDGSHGSAVLENFTFTTADPSSASQLSAESTTTAIANFSSTVVDEINYDCATMSVIGSSSTPKYLISEADTLDGRTYEEVGPFAITFLPTNGSANENQELSVVLVTLETGQFFRGFFVKCGTRELMRENANIHREQVNPASLAMYLTGSRSQPVFGCNFTGAAAKQSDLKPKVEQILFVTLPAYQNETDIVLTCWATVVVNSSDYWIISSSMPLIRRQNTEKPTTTTSVATETTTNLVTEETTITTTTAETTTTSISTSSTTEATTDKPTTMETTSSSLTTTATTSTKTSTHSLEVIDCSAMALFDDIGDSGDSVLSIDGDEVYFNFTSTMAEVPFGFVTGSLVFSDDVLQSTAAYLFGCTSASLANYTSPSSSENFGIVHEVTTPELENNDNVVTLPSWCGENFRQENAYFVKSTKKIHFAWHLPETFEATSGVCRVVILLTNGSYILRHSDLIEIVHKTVSDPATSTDSMSTTVATGKAPAVVAADMLYGFPSSMSCSHLASTLLSPQRFRDCLDCGSKMAALEFVENSVKLGGNMTIGVVSADSDFVISDFVFSCYAESTGEPVGKLYEAPIQANLLPAIHATIGTIPVSCRKGVIRNRDVGPVYEVFFVWVLPEWIPYSSKELRCSVMFPSLPTETLLIVDSLPLRRVGSNYEIPASATMKPLSSSSDYEHEIATTTTTGSTAGTTTFMSFRILPSVDQPGLDPFTHRFKYDCAEFSVRLPETSNKTSLLASPYSLHVSSTEFQDGHSLNLVVNSSDPHNRQFRGFMVSCAHGSTDGLVTFKADTPAGRLVETLVDGRVLSATGGCGSRVEVSARQLKHSIAFLWKASVVSELPVQCRAVVIEDEYNYWTLNGPVMHLIKPTTAEQTTETTAATVEITKSSVDEMTTLATSTSKPKKIIVLTIDGLKKLGNSTTGTTAELSTPDGLTTVTKAVATPIIAEPFQETMIRKGETAIVISETFSSGESSFDGELPVTTITTVVETTTNPLPATDEAVASENFIEVAMSSSSASTLSPTADTVRKVSNDVAIGSGSLLEAETPLSPESQANQEIEQAYAAPAADDTEEEPIAIEIFQPNPIAAELVTSLHPANNDTFSPDETSDLQITHDDASPPSVFFSRGFDCRRDGHSCHHDNDPFAKCDRFTGKCICSRSTFSGYDCSITEVLPSAMCNNGRGCLNDGVCGRRFDRTISATGEVITSPVEKCFCPYDYLGDFCEIPRVSAQCDNVDGMRIQVIPFSNDKQSAFAGSVRIVSTPNKTLDDKSHETSALLLDEGDCDFQSSMSDNSSGIYVLDRPFSVLIDKCGARMAENSTVYVQFMIQYSAFDMLTAFDPVYLVYCDLASLATTAEPVMLHNAKKKKYEKLHNNVLKLLSRRPPSLSKLQMTFASKVAVSSSLDSLPRQVVTALGNSTQLYQTASDQTIEQIRHNMSFVIRKRSPANGGNVKITSESSGAPISVDEVRLSDILEIEISNHDTSYFKYIYLDECRVDFDHSRHSGALLVTDGCPTPTVRRYLVDWMAADDEIANGELLNSAVGVAANDSFSASASFSYSAFWPADSLALSFNCSIRLCGVDMADDCPQKICPPIPGFTLRHRRRKRDVEDAQIKEQRRKAERAKRQKELEMELARKEQLARGRRSEQPMRPGPRRFEWTDQVTETLWSMVWATVLTLAYIAGIYFLLGYARRLYLYLKQKRTANKEKKSSD